MRKRILLLDSGVGGLTVLRETRAAIPGADYVYVADDAAFPYGGFREDRLVAHLLDLVGRLVAEHRPDLVVVACNTASTIALPALRRSFALPFVGTVPAIKPACAMSVTKMVSVLGTTATVDREYTRALIRDHAQGCRVTLIGSANLAAHAELELAGNPVPNTAIRAELGPCFVDDGMATDTIVLACTHYPLLVHRFRALAPWPVTFVDPAPAIARRVAELLAADPAVDGTGAARVVCTSGRSPAGLFAPFGLEAVCMV